MQRIEREHVVMDALRRRIASVEQTNGDLLAFARGHAGAVAAIHEAVLAVLSAETPEMLAAIVAHEWPCLLGVDAVAFAWSVGDRALVADLDGIRPFEPRLVTHLLGIDEPLTARITEQGHPLFGRAKGEIRAEIGIRLEGESGLGLLMLGQHGGMPGAPAASIRLLRFLGRAVVAMLERWPPR